jgi:hypothetical protein
LLRRSSTRPGQGAPGLGLERAQARPQVLRGRIGELADADIGLAARQQLGADTLHRDRASLQLDDEGRVHTFPLETQDHARPYGAAHAPGRLLEVSGADGHAVHGNDDVSRRNAGEIGGAPVDRRDDPQGAVLRTQLDADAGIFPAGADTDVLELGRIEQGGMGVEVGNHAADRGVDELAVIDHVDIVALHAFHDLGKQARFLPRQGVSLGRLLGHHGRSQRNQEPERDAKADGKHSAEQQWLHQDARRVFKSRKYQILPVRRRPGPAHPGIGDSCTGTVMKR